MQDRDLLGSCHDDWSEWPKVLAYVALVAAAVLFCIGLDEAIRAAHSLVP